MGVWKYKNDAVRLDIICDLPAVPCGLNHVLLILKDCLLLCYLPWTAVIFLVLMSSFYSLHFSSLAIRLLLEQASLWEPRFFLESLLLICFGQEDKQAPMCRLRLAPCLPFHWTSTMTCQLSAEEDELTNQTQTLPSKKLSPSRRRGCDPWR